MNAQTIANTILGQLKATGSLFMMCWGARKFTYGTNDSKNHFLEFKVNGFIHKGQVRVTLEGNDTYTVTLYEGRARKVTSEKNMIYCDQLADIIDGMVEKNCSEDDYAQKCNEAIYNL